MTEELAGPSNPLAEALAAAGSEKIWIQAFHPHPTLGFMAGGSWA